MQLRPLPTPKSAEKIDPVALKQAMVTCLKAGLCLDMKSSLTIYPESGYFVVDFLKFDSEPIPNGLSKNQQLRLCKEEEVDEFFDSPEEAVELFLKMKEKDETSDSKSSGCGRTSCREPDEDD